MADDGPDEQSLLEEAGAIETRPNEAADPPNIASAKVPADIYARYEVLSYRNAAVILAETHPAEFFELLTALRSFSITTEMIRRAGGNESEMPKLFSATLRPQGWHETIIRGDLVTTLTWREQTGVNKKGKPVYEPRSKETRRERYLDGHKIDFVKNGVAFDLEWNSKDQTFDRDLYAFNAFFMSGAIDAGVLVTRGNSLQLALRKLGLPKYGASTTWWGKLVYRLNAGRNGGCPVLALGITPACISDWQHS
jgi:Restriction endonuclease BglII